MEIEIVCDECGAVVHSDCDLGNEIENLNDTKTYYECKQCESSKFRLRQG